VVGYQALDDEERTELADAGINMIQETSNGIYVRNWFTPSTDTMYLFGNGILMRDYIQVSIVDSLKLTENEPNSYNKIQGSRSIIVTFFEKLWKYGSTGKAPEGETFGQTFDPETNEASNKKQHFKIQADFINNPQANISVGERNYDTWFTYPSPAGSIKIGVGLMSFNS
jgi:phage tail sheath protein FI